MKVIDLLNKIANGEELPKKIQVYNSKYRLLDNRTYHSIDHEGRLGQNYALDGMLNDDVKIIEDTPKEDKKIEKLNEHIFVDVHSMVLKINEIIDKVNKL